jgi:transposase
MTAISYLYHAMGLNGYQHFRTEYREGKVVYHVEKVLEKRTCKACGAPWYELTMDGRFERTFLGLPVGMKRQEVVLHGHIQLCNKCGKRVREPIDFAKGSSRCIRAVERFAVELCQITTIKWAAKFLGLGWDFVKDAFKAALQRRHKAVQLSDLRYIAVDEFSIQKNHKYMTIVLNLETGAILHAQEGKGSDALKPFLEQVKQAKAPLQAVAMDMSEAFASAVRQVFGDSVDIVNDPFHVVALASKAIDETRRDLARNLEGNEKKTIKGTRFLLLGSLENQQESSLERLMALMDANEPLYMAYLMKEDLRMFWSLPNGRYGEVFLDQWIRNARSFGNSHFEKLANTLDSHRSGLLSYFRHRISSGPIEGLNHKIKVLKRQAYGFRDMEFFKLRLYFLHKTPLMLAG